MDDDAVERAALALMNHERIHAGFEPKQSLAEFRDDEVALYKAKVTPILLVMSLSSTAPETPVPSVPDGWKLVPVEPTEEMFDASYYLDCPTPRETYEAMLAAAPEPPVQEPLTMSMFASRADLEAEREKRAQPASSELVAWQYRYRPTGANEWSDWGVGEAPVMRSGSYETQERPLYTHPAPVKEVVEALEGIITYASDTLSGRADGGATDREWFRYCVVELRSRARLAYTALVSLTKEQG